MLSCFAKVSPLRRPYNSAAMEWVRPMFPEKPPIQEPELALIRPPALPLLGLLKRTEPFVLSLKKPVGKGEGGTG